MEHNSKCTMDINEEYENIFGITQRPTLYAPDDAEYLSLRQEIIDAPRVFNYKRVLPFEGIKLCSYDDFKRDEIVREAESHGYRIFYIKKYSAHRLVCYAAGYFEAKDNTFVVLKDAFFKQSDYFTELTRNISNIYARKSFLKSFFFSEGKIIQKEQRIYESASLAASYILGQKSSFREWKDVRSRSLDAYYAMYKLPNIDEKEDLSFQTRVFGGTEAKQKQMISSVIQSLVKRATKAHENDLRTKTKIDSLPQVAISKDNSIHYFYITRTLNSYRNCDAKGYYDPITQKFILKEGSYVALDMSDTYKCTTAGIARKKHIDKVCSKEFSGYRLKKDLIFDSPSSAASYVLGYSANGWTEWKDEHNNTLDSVYKY